MDETQTLLRDISAFLDERKMAESTFGRKAVNDGKLLQRMRKGQSITLKTAAKIRGYIVATRSSSPTIGIVASGLRQ